MTERILVVDDEKLLRWASRKYRVGFDYGALEAENGREVLDENEARGCLLYSDSGAGLRARSGGGGAVADLTMGSEWENAHG
jgi:hypothetical protein